MAGKNATTTPALDITVTIAAPPGRVFRAFFDPDALGAWWRVLRAVTAPRLLAPYAVEWATTDFQDAALGRLGGIFRGTIVQCEPGANFLVADAFWLPPDGDPIGPMALEVTVTPDGSGTRLHVSQRGFEESERWRRYYELIGHGWERALASMKALLEK